jgi:hypothetical protein
MIGHHGEREANLLRSLGVTYNLVGTVLFRGKFVTDFNHDDPLSLQKMISSVAQ